MVKFLMSSRTGMIAAALLGLGLLCAQENRQSEQIRIPAGGEWDEQRIFDVLEQLGGYQLEKLEVVQHKWESGKTSLEIVAQGVKAPPEWPSHTCAEHPVYLRVLHFANQVIALVPLQKGRKEPSKGKVKRLAESCRGALPAGRVYRISTPARETLYQDGQKTARLYWLKIQMQLRNTDLELPRKIGHPPE